jgi:prepilin-type N-terminal cleavage/methylation domain-containing protein
MVSNQPEQQHQQGFTLIELLVVISVISLLSTVVLASLNSARLKAQKAAGLNFSSSIHHALGAYAVGQWDFNGLNGSTAYDESGSSRNGTVSNASLSSDTPTGNGYSLLFTGTNSEVQVANSSDFRFGTGDYAFSFWVKHTAVTSYNTYFESGSWGGNTLILRQDDANTLMVYLNGVVGYAYSFSPQVGQWYHIALTRDNGVRRIYINGAQLGASMADTFDISPTAVLKIGSSVHTDGQRLNGYMDNFRIYNRSLTTAEVHELYALGND